MTIGVRYTGHAKERCKQRNIDKEKRSINDILKFPIYTTDDGCTKYLDIENNYVYYIRKESEDQYKIVTAIKINPIQMLRYYAFGKNLDFKCLCRDHAFNNCKRGAKCKYIHV